MVYTPLTTSSIVACRDGQHAAIQERSRITLVALPTGTTIGQLGPEIAASHDGATTQLAWIGSEPRLIVLRHEAAGCQVLLVELGPAGPRVIAEALFKAPMRLMATAGVFALVTGSQGTFVLSTSQGWFTAYQLPTMTAPTAACAVGDHFLLAHAGSIDEWDPATRVVKRRLRLLRQAHITSIGRSGRTVWVTTSAEPRRIDGVALVEREQPKAWSLPEPIASASGSERGELIACVGASTGRVYLIDPSGHGPLRVLPTDATERADAVAVLEVRPAAVLVARAGQPLIMVASDGRELAFDAPRARGSSIELRPDALPAVTRPPAIPERARSSAPPVERSLSERFASRRAQRRHTTMS